MMGFDFRPLLALVEDEIAVPSLLGLFSSYQALQSFPFWWRQSSNNKNSTWQVEDTFKILSVLAQYRKLFWDLD